MLNPSSKIKDLSNQSIEDKMYLLKLLANQMLGARWMYYRKIKLGDSGFKLLKEKSLMEQMKATRAALRFTSKNTKKIYRQVYLECLKDIKNYTGLKEGFPDLPEVVEKQEIPSLTSDFDAVIISWTPLKFLVPAQTIRSKGLATQRHSEGLVSKLYFKVAAYYAVEENWDVGKLTMYLRKINQESKYQDIVTALAPLKDDLQKFSEVFVLFKFGKASLSKDVGTDADAFDDAMSVESFDSELSTLYWYDFIFRALELFLFRYYLIFVTSTASIETIEYISTIFKPALQKAIENKNVFIGSFETDRTKKEFRIPYRKYAEEKLKESLKKKIKTKEGIFESYCYNLNLLQKFGISPDIEDEVVGNTKWVGIIKNYVMDEDRPAVDYESANEKDVLANLEENALTHLETRQHMLVQIMNTLVICSQYKREARYQILERFKQMVKTDFELGNKRIKSIRNNADKKIRDLERKINKYKRLKQQKTVVTLLQDIDTYKKSIATRIETIRQDSKKELEQQKARLNSLFKEISKEKARNLAMAATNIMGLVSKLDTSHEFSRSMIGFLAKSLQQKYVRDLEPFYRNIFAIFEISLEEKVLIINSLEKSSDEESIRLSLDKQEEEQFEKIIIDKKAEIEKQQPDLFSGKIIISNLAIPTEELFQVNIDHRSFHNLLCLKIASPKSTQYLSLKPDIIKMMVDLNRVINPVPKNIVAQVGREKEKDYEKRINSVKLKSLLDQLR